MRRNSRKEGTGLRLKTLTVNVYPYDWMKQWLPEGNLRYTWQAQSDCCMIFPSAGVSARKGKRCAAIPENSLLQSHDRQRWTEYAPRHQEDLYRRKSSEEHADHKICEGKKTDCKWKLKRKPLKILSGWSEFCPRTGHVKFERPLLYLSGDTVSARRCHDDRHENGECRAQCNAGKEKTVQIFDDFCPVGTQRRQYSRQHGSWSFESNIAAFLSDQYKCKDNHRKIYFTISSSSQPARLPFSESKFTPTMYIFRLSSKYFL